MKICMVTPMYPPEQAAVALLPKFIGDALESEGNTVHYITFTPRNLPGKPSGNITYMKPFFREHNAKGRRIPVLKTILHALVRSSRVIKSSDVVHVHSYTTLFYSTFLLCKLYRKPCLITLYGEMMEYPKESIKKTGMFYLCLNYFMDAVVFYSESLKEYANSLNITPKRSAVIYPFISDVFFRVPGTPENEKIVKEHAGPTLFCVKGLHPVSGIEYLIRAMPLIRRDFPDTKLYLCGDGPQRKELETLTQQQCLQSHVTFLGPLPNNELKKYYRSADVFVLPSLVDSFSHVILESIACGTPVVAAENTGTRELKEKFPDHVILVPQKDSDALSDGVSHALREKKKSSLPPAPRLLENFRMENTINQYADIYKRLSKMVRPAHCGSKPCD